MRTAWVEAGSVAGLGRAGGDGGMLTVSLAAEARAAAPRSERIEGRCILIDCTTLALSLRRCQLATVKDVVILKE